MWREMGPGRDGAGVAVSVRFQLQAIVSLCKFVLFIFFVRSGLSLQHTREPGTIVPHKCDRWSGVTTAQWARGAASGGGKVPVLRTTFLKPRPFGASIAHERPDQAPRKATKSGGCRIPTHSCLAVVDPYRLYLREKLSTSEERRRRAERAKVDVRRALAAAIDANR